MNRREFLTRTSKVACACGIGLTTSSLLTSCTNPTSPEIEDTSGVELQFDISENNFSALQSNGGSVITDSNEIDSKGLLLLRSNDQVKAFTRNCTHAGYALLAFENGLSICSSYHGGQFDVNGVAVSNPATGILKSYDTDLNDNILTVYGS